MLDLAKIKQYLPPYLTKDAKEALFKVIKENWPKSNDPYILYKKNDYKGFLQGDCLFEVVFPTYEDGEIKKGYCNGVILSNTCDIDQKNNRSFEVNVTFASVLSLKDFKYQLKLNKINDNKISDILKSLRENRISNLFYLPELVKDGSVYLEESFIRLDEITSFDSNLLYSYYKEEYIENDGDKIFTFSQYGFYLFLYKLAYHFSRMREDIIR